MNELQPINIRFTETAKDTADSVIRSLDLMPLMSVMKDDNTPEETKALIGNLLIALSDIFETALPNIDGTTEENLMKVSRDLSLSKLLRERGLFRMYRLTTEFVNNIPVWSYFLHPLTGEPFSSREKFIDWFVAEAHVSRGMLYQRLADIKRLLSLGFDLEQAYEVVLTKPYVISTALKLIVNWDDENNVGNIDPAIVLMTAKKIADRIDPTLLPRLTAMAENDMDDPEERRKLTEEAIPVMHELINELAGHDRAKDAMKMLKNDILLQPEIIYMWDEDTPSLMVTLVMRQLDPETGEERELPPVVVPFVPDVTILPDEIRQDIIKRLPIANRKFLDL